LGDFLVAPALDFFGAMCEELTRTDGCVREGPERRICSSASTTPPIARMAAANAPTARTPRLSLVSKAQARTHKLVIRLACDGFGSGACTCHRWHSATAWLHLADIAGVPTCWRTERGSRPRSERCCPEVPAVLRTVGGWASRRSRIAACSCCTAVRPSSIPVRCCGRSRVQSDGRACRVGRRTPRLCRWLLDTSGAPCSRLARTQPFRG
jgi:hypothetical protein